MVEHVIEQGATEFDYLRGEHSYKHMFADGARHTETVRVYRQRGAAYLDRWARTHVLAKMRAWAKAGMKSMTNRTDHIAGKNRP
jgi:hypothetical protein